MNITLNIPEETQEVYFEIAKERNITKEKLMEEAILEYLDDYKTALKLREARLNGETGESWQTAKFWNKNLTTINLKEILANTENAI